MSRRPEENCERAPWVQPGAMLTRSAGRGDRGQGEDTEAPSAKPYSDADLGGPGAKSDIELAMWSPGQGDIKDCCHPLHSIILQGMIVFASPLVRKNNVANKTRL